MSAKKRARKLAAARKRDRRREAAGKQFYEPSFKVKIASAASFLSTLRLFEVQMQPARSMFQLMSWVKLTGGRVLYRDGNDVIWSERGVVGRCEVT